MNFFYPRGLSTEEFLSFLHKITNREIDELYGKNCSIWRILCIAITINFKFNLDSLENYCLHYCYETSSDKLWMTNTPSLILHIFQL